MVCGTPIHRDRLIQPQSVSIPERVWWFVELAERIAELVGMGAFQSLKGFGGLWNEKAVANRNELDRFNP